MDEGLMTERYKGAKGLDSALDVWGRILSMGQIMLM